MEKTLNQREIYKQNKLNTVSQVYICECGKNYLTFSALYLHVRNKHQIKLTTKKSPQICSVEQVDGKHRITYFLKPNPKDQKRELAKYLQRNLIDETTRFKPLLEAFLGCKKSEPPREWNKYCEVIKAFCDYLEKFSEPNGLQLSNA